MSRLPKIALRTVLGFFLFLLLVWAGRAVYLRHLAKQEHMADLESKVQDLLRVAHPPWHVREGRFSISTTDRPENTNWTDFRLVYGTNAPQTFDYVIWKEAGHIVTAWVSDWTPRSEMAKMERFSVSWQEGASFKIIAMARTNESIAMEFKVTFIVE